MEVPDRKRASPMELAEKGLCTHTADSGMYASGEMRWSVSGTVRGAGKSGPHFQICCQATTRLSKTSSKQLLLQ